jgi:DNA uptake protein and related DNA-binding proteins
MVKKRTKKQEKEIDINTADSATLTTIYGIGPYFAQNIIKYRERLGGSFVSIFQLQEIYGIDSSKFNIIKNQITITGTPIKFSLSEAEFKQLARNPYIGNKTAKEIIRFRMEKGCKECNLQNLLKANIIDSLQVEQLKNS